MPELPEVETVKRTLLLQIIGEKVNNVKVYYSPIIENVRSDEFISALKGETLRDITRYGKYLIFIFDNVSIVSHLRMEGKFFIKDREETKNIHEHIIFEFESGRTLRFHDTRKFGKMVLLKTTNIHEIMNYPSLKKLGPEANSDNLTPEYLFSKISKRSDEIKKALLDQEVLAGLGNIYVDEVCFLCQIHPTLSCKLITYEDCINICTNSKKVLTKAIEAGGTTIRSYTSSLGVTGRFQLSLHVHTKEGESCEVCGTIIEKIFVGGRGTYFCKNCQIIRKPKVIGITGGIATGKSTVTNYLKENGYTVFDSDEIVKKLLLTKSVINQIGVVFGSEYISGNKIDKVKLGSLIFNNKEEREKLNRIIHPLVKDKLKYLISRSKEQIVFVDVPLLYEAKFEDLCDKVIVVKTNLEINIERLMKRDNINEEYAKIKIASQMNIEEKCQKANFIIDNSSDICYTYMQTKKIIKELEEK